MSPIFNDQVLDHVGARAGINAHPAHINAAHFPRSEFVEFQNVAAFDQHDLAHRAVHRSSHLRMQLELPVFPVHRNEVARLHQVDDEL